MERECKLVSIDVGELKDEVSDLQEFLERKLSVEIRVEDKVMGVGSAEERLSRRKVKEYVERFFHRRGLSDTYRVRSEKDAIKIVKRKT